MIVDDELIAKFLSGEADPEEAMALDDWLKIPGNKTHFDEMVATWNITNPSKQLRASNKEEAWRRVRPAKRLGWPIGIAASLLLVVGFWFYNSNPEGEVIRVIANENVDTIKLEDETVVTLNKHSSIEYSKEYNKESRQINLLSGEAFFSVTKDQQKPFVVNAAFSTITVLGTEFNVQINDDVVEVGVYEGTVAVGMAGDTLYHVRAGSSMIFRKNLEVAPKENDPNTWAYATRKLVFKDTPMTEVIAALEKTYSCTINVSNDNIKKCTLNTTFDQYSVDKILLLISESLNLKLEQNGQVFTLEGDGCP